MAGAQGDDPAWLLLVLLCVFGLIGWAIWYFFQPQILDFLRYVRLVEYAIPALVDDRNAACFTWLREAQIGRNIPTESVVKATYGCFGKEAVLKLSTNDALKFYNISSESMSWIGRRAGQWVMWALIALCGWAVYYANFVSKRGAFKTRHNLESFIKVQSQIWPVIKPITTFNPSKAARVLGGPVPDKLPLFAEALAPEEWLSFHRIPVVNGVPDRESVRRAFCLQLGPRWNGFFDLPPFMQGLCAAYALKGVQKREESDEFLGKLSLCWTAQTGYRPTPEITSEIRRILKDPEVGGKALEIANKHAYRTTAILALLKWARFMGGVLAAAQFLWVRGVDREIWYALNNLGRRSFHTEGAGAIAHFMAEEQAGKALPIPRMDTAIVTLNIYMGGDIPVQVPPRQETDMVRG